MRGSCLRKIVSLPSGVSTGQGRARASFDSVGEIHVVVVVVAEQDRVERRQVLDAQAPAAWRASVRASPTARRAPTKRVGQQVDALASARGTSNGRRGRPGSLSPRRATAGRGRAGSAGLRPGSALGPRLAQHLEEVAERLVARAARREEPQAVEMIGDRAGVIGIARHVSFADPKRFGVVIWFAPTPAKGRRRSTCRRWPGSAAACGGGIAPFARWTPRTRKRCRKSPPPSSRSRP